MADPWFTKYVKAYLRQQGQNDAAPYGVTIEPVPNARYRAIGTHHLTPAENRGNHHAYIIILDAQGKRIKGIPVGYTWIGRRDNQNAPPPADDKPDDEPGCNIPMGMYQIISLWVEGTGPSDVVAGITPAHADEAPGNTVGHHSFLVVFQEGEANAPSPPLAGGTQEGAHPLAGGTEGGSDPPLDVLLGEALAYELTNAAHAIANAQNIIAAVKGAKS
jgi:hypothetical protein